MKKTLTQLFVALALAQSAVAMAQSVPVPMVMPVVPQVEIRVQPPVAPPHFTTCEELHTCAMPHVIIDPPPPLPPCTYDRDCGVVKVAPKPVAINRAR